MLGVLNMTKPEDQKYGNKYFYEAVQRENETCLKWTSGRKEKPL
jgi:hypothetical protein